MSSTGPRTNAASALEDLAAELAARGYETQLATGPDAAPWLAVRNPDATMLSETVSAHEEWFWWPWADRIAPTADVSQAANRVASVLRAEPARR